MIKGRNVCVKRRAVNAVGCATETWVRRILVRSGGVKCLQKKQSTVDLVSGQRGRLEVLQSNQTKQTM